jgi:hypothetical protein
MALYFDPDKNGKAKADAVALKNRSIGIDVSLSFQPLHPSQAWRRRKSHTSGKIDVAQSAIGLKRRHDSAVNGIQISFWH